MSEGERFELLKTKHAELETALESEEHKLQPDPVTVSELKKRKLRIKDQLASIEAHA